MRPAPAGGPGGDPAHLGHHRGGKAPLLFGGGFGGHPLVFHPRDAAFGGAGQPAPALPAGGAAGRGQRPAAPGGGPLRGAGGLLRAHPPPGAGRRPIAPNRGRLPGGGAGDAAGLHRPGAGALPGGRGGVRPHQRRQPGGSVRRRLEGALGCRVYDHYGSTEMGYGGALACGQGPGLHLREADLYFEVVDPATGRPLPEGAFGELVFTTLTRRGMPLVRYRTGDLTRFLPGACPCGCPLRRIAPPVRWGGHPAAPDGPAACSPFGRCWIFPSACGGGRPP